MLLVLTRREFAFSAVLLTLAFPAAAQQTVAEDVCAQAAMVPVPSMLLPTALQAAKLVPGCSPLELYYATTPGHLRQARLCGLAQWQHETRLDAQHVEAPRIHSSQFLALAMVFANGEGTPRNVPLARRFACLAVEDGFSDSENILKATDAGDLQVCSKEGSFFGRQPNYDCLLVQQTKVKDQLQREEARARRILSPARWAAWQTLQSARSDYLEAHEPELPTGNTGAVQSGMDDMLNLDRAWISVLRSVEKGDPPEGFAHAASFSDVDKQLNLQYADRLKDAAEYPALISPAELRAAERAWLRYREAWVRFGTARWSQTTADQWRSWLTAQRMEEMG